MRRTRSAEQVALHLRAAEILHSVTLLQGLDPFGSRDHVAVGGDADHRPDDRGP